MMHFTKTQIEEIRRQLSLLGVRDTDLPDVTSMTGEEEVAIVQDGENRKVSIRNLFAEFAEDIIIDVKSGLSAYEIAVKHGFTGTEEEWLRSLEAHADPVNVVNNLTSGGTTKALSAEMGKYLKALIDNIEPGGLTPSDIVNNLVTGGTDKALSAEQGKVLKRLLDDIPITEIVDNLTAGGSDKALSAEQGKILKQMIDAIETGGEYEGAFKSLVFLRSNSPTVSTPTGGTYLSPIPTSTPAWSDGIPSGEQTLWMSTRWFYLNAEAQASSVWTTPQKITDTSTVDFEFSDVAVNPGTPDSNPLNWHDPGVAGDIWMATRIKNNGTLGTWSVVKIKGEAGEAPDASFTSFVFKNSATAPSTPGTGTTPGQSNYGGTYADPIPYGWYDSIDGTNVKLTSKVWMTSRMFSSNGEHGNWATPLPVGDNEYIDYEWCTVDSAPGNPTKSSPDATETAFGWYDEPGDAPSGSSFYWMAVRPVLNGVYETGSSWKVIRIKGERGDQGTSLHMKGSFSDPANLPTSENEEGDTYLYTGTDNYTYGGKTWKTGHLYVWDGTDDWIDAGNVHGSYLHIKYSTDGTSTFTGPQDEHGVNQGEEPGDYIGMYIDDDPTDSMVFSDYAPWRKWRGEDGFGYEYVFKLNDSPSAPDLPSTSVNQDDWVPTSEGWTDNAGDVSPANKYCWVAWRKKTDGVWSAWKGAENNTKARLFAHYGTDGVDGDDGVTKFKSIVFTRSNLPVSAPVVKDNITDPDDPQFSGSFANPVPYGWTDGISNSAGLLWMTTRMFSSDGNHQSTWTTPQIAADTETMDFEWSDVSDPGMPNKATPDSINSNRNWKDEPGDFDDPSSIIWMAVRPVKNAAYETGSSWSLILLKGENGVSGYNTAIAYLYKRTSASNVTVDFSNRLTYSFTAKAITSAAPSGWFKTIPPDDGNPLYVVAATAMSRGETDDIEYSEWSEPVLYTKSGLNSASIMLYQRAATVPNKPNAVSTYTFATGILSASFLGTGIDGKWSRVVPNDNGYPCYVTQATALGAGATDQLQISEWSDVTKLVEDGTSPLTVDTQGYNVISIPCDSDGNPTSVPNVNIKCTLLRGNKAIQNAVWDLDDNSSLTLENGATVFYQEKAAAVDYGGVTYSYCWSDDSDNYYTEYRDPRQCTECYYPDDELIIPIISQGASYYGLVLSYNGVLSGQISGSLADSTIVSIKGTDPATNETAFAKIVFEKNIPGAPGEQGERGLSGKVARGVTEFTSSPSFDNYWGLDDTETDHIFYDVVMYNNTLYYCKAWKKGTTLAKNIIPGEDASVWVTATGFRFIATDLLLAQNAYIGFLTNQGLYLKNSSGEVVGGAQGSDGVVFWAGADGLHPDSADFQVHRDGYLEAANAKIRGEIEVTNLKIADDAGNTALSINGNDFSVGTPTKSYAITPVHESYTFPRDYGLVDQVWTDIELGSVTIPAAGGAGLTIPAVSLQITYPSGSSVSHCGWYYAIIVEKRVVSNGVITSTYYNLSGTDVTEDIEEENYEVLDSSVSGSDTSAVTTNHWSSQSINAGETYVMHLFRYGFTGPTDSGIFEFTLTPLNAITVTLADSAQAINIGSNGFQVSLGGGWFVSATVDNLGDKTILLSGKSSTNSDLFIRIDKNGIVKKNKNDVTEVLL